MEQDKRQNRPESNGQPGGPEEQGNSDLERSRQEAADLFKAVDDVIRHALEGQDSEEFVRESRQRGGQ